MQKPEFIRRLTEELDRVAAYVERLRKVSDMKYTPGGEVFDRESGILNAAGLLTNRLQGLCQLIAPPAIKDPGIRGQIERNRAALAKARGRVLSDPIDAMVGGDDMTRTELAAQSKEGEVAI